MRKLNRNATATATAPTPPATPPTTPAPTPPPQVVKAEVVVESVPASQVYAPAAPAPSKGAALPAVPFAGSQIGAYKRTEETPLAASGVPYIQFYEQRAGNASQMIQRFGALQTGTPIVVEGDNAVLLGSAGLVILDEFRHWVQLDTSDFKPIAVSLTNRPGYKENILTLALVVPDRDGKLDENLAPAYATVTTFRGPKGTFVKQVMSAVDDASRAEWAKRNDYHAKLVEAGVPPRFRVVGTPVLKGRTASSGFAYVECQAAVAPISPMQVEKLAGWWNNEECQAQLQGCTETFARIAASLREQAAESK